MLQSPDLPRTGKKKKKVNMDMETMLCCFSSSFKVSLAAVNHFGPLTHL